MFGFTELNEAVNAPSASATLPAISLYVLLLYDRLSIAIDASTAVDFFMMSNPRPLTCALAVTSPNVLSGSTECSGNVRMSRSASYDSLAVLNFASPTALPVASAKSILPAIAYPSNDALPVTLIGGKFTCLLIWASSNVGFMKFRLSNTPFIDKAPPMRFSSITLRTTPSIFILAYRGRSALSSFTFIWREVPSAFATICNGR